jgi:protein-tyrosine kinase
MSKHSPLSSIERAAQIYDFSAALRAPAVHQAPEPVVEPVAEPEVAPRIRPRPIEREEIVAVAAELPAPFELEARDVAPVDRAALVRKGFVVPGGLVTGLAEEFRLVKRQLLNNIARRVSLPEEKRRTVLICSGQPDEGKSFCAINLALSLSGERENEVLLIDGDFSKPEVLKSLGIADGPGLVEALADPRIDPEELVIRTDVPGLSVLPSGRKTNNVPELLASDRTREVLAKLVAGDGRRIILIDSPPALMASPATVLAGHVGQTLVVVRADQTTEADLRETIGLLSACDHVGLLLNGAGIAVSARKFGAYDGYGHDQD